MTIDETNWAGNIAYRAARFHTPDTAEALQAIVAGAEKVRALGSRHCFNTIADTDGDLISMRRLNKLIAIDREAMTVTVEGGMTYGELGPELDAAGFALHNLASLPHITVVGGVATATHGSGNANGNLATAVAGVKLVTADGGTLELKRGDADFEGAVVNLGALGIVSEITLDILPAFDVRQNVYLDLPFATLIENFANIYESAYSVSCFTDWRGDLINQVWLKNRAEAPLPPAEFFGAKAAPGPVHPIPDIDPEPTTGQMGEVGRWHMRLPHFDLDFLPSVGAELQSEYFIARADAAAAIAALHAVQDGFSEHLMIAEIRTIAADTLWMSMNYQRDSVAFHFTFKRDWPNVQKALPVIEAALKPFGARPHWGKLFTMTPDEVQAGSPRIGDFRDLVRRTDPAGKFTNDFVKTYVL